ncbi:unnamed protein product [Gadus morhua 'NCC']
MEGVRIPLTEEHFEGSLGSVVVSEYGCPGPDHPPTAPHNAVTTEHCASPLSPASPRPDLLHGAHCVAVRGVEVTSSSPIGHPRSHDLRTEPAQSRAGSEQSRLRTEPVPSRACSEQKAQSVS